MKKFLILIFIQLLIVNQNILQAQWVKTNGPYYWHETVKSIAVDNNNVYAGTYSKLYKSTNGGLNWIQINNNGSASGYNSLVISGNNIFAATDVGIYRSTDAGVNWSLVNSGLPQYTQISAIAIAGNNIFAGGSKGVYLSTNNGSNWSSANNGLPNKWVKTIVIKGDDLFIGSTGGIYYSSDNGTNWYVRNSGLTDSSIVELCIKDDDLLAGTWNGGIYYSNNQGLTWTYKGLTGLYIHGIGICQNNIITSTYPAGVFISTDNGSTWSSINNGLMNHSVFSLAINGDSVYIGNEEGVHLSLNNDFNWSPLNNGFMQSVLTSISPMGEILYAGTYWGGLYSSADNGLNWDRIIPQSFSINISYMTINGTNIFCAWGQTVYFSSNNGETWNIINNGLPTNFHNINSIFSIFSSVFIGSGTEGIYQTTNNGLNWYPRNNGIVWPYPSINSFAFDGYRIFVGSSRGVYLSLNYGTTWTLMNTGLTNTDVLSVAFIGEDIIAGTAGGGVHISTDYGSSWSPVNNGLTGMRVNSLTVSNNKISALINTDKIYFSSNNGSSWSLVGDGSIDDFLTNLWSINEFIYVGSHEGVLWRRLLSEITGVELEKTVPNNYQLYQNYPNPFNPTTKIKYSIPQTSFVTLKVYDILGRGVTTLVNEEKPVGNYEVEFSSNALANGIYFYRLQTGNFVETKKMILLK